MPDLTDEQRKQLEEKLKNMSPEELKQFQKQQCIFCQIISGKVPSKKVYEDALCIAVLDISPASKGHLLIMPKEHYAIMPQIPEKEMGHIFLVAKYLSQALLKVLKVSGTNIFVANGPAAGQRAQHFMLHLIPRKEGDKLLEVEDKLVDAALRAKVKELIEPKLNALLGVKKEMQKTLPKEEQKKTKEVEEKAEKEEEETSEPEESVKEAVWKEEGEEEEEKPAKGKAKGKSAKKEKTSKKETKKESPKIKSDKNSKSSSDEAPSLDDIANLFK